MWSKMIQNLPCLATLKTLGFGRFVYTMCVISSSPDFWFGFLCGMALTLAAGVSFLYIISGILRVQMDPSSHALSPPLMEKDTLQTTVNISIQDVALLNTLITVLWGCTAKSSGERIKKCVEETLDDLAVNASKRMSQLIMGPGEPIDQVLCDVKKKFENYIQNVIHFCVTRLGTKRVILNEIDLGTKPPKITAFRCESGVDEPTFEMKFLWKSEGAILRLSFDLCGHREVIEVKNVHLQVTVKIVLKPRREEFPGFGAVVIFLKEDPLVDFDLKALDGRISSHIKKKFQEFIETNLTELIVWPSRFVLPWIPGEDFSFLESCAVGELRVRLIKAENIMSTYHIGRVHYFVKIFVRQSRVKCSTAKKSSEPAVWDETMTVEVEDPQTQKLTLQLFRKSRASRLRIPDKFIGSLKLAITQFKPDVTMEMSCDLKDPGSETNEICGKLSLAITYHPFHMGAGLGPGRC